MNRTLKNQSCDQCGAELPPRILPRLRCPYCGRLPELPNNPAVLGCLGSLLMAMVAGLAVGLVVTRLEPAFNWPLGFGFAMGFVTFLDLIAVSAFRSELSRGNRPCPSVFHAGGTFILGAWMSFRGIVSLMWLVIAVIGNAALGVLIGRYFLDQYLSEKERAA